MAGSLARRGRGAYGCTPSRDAGKGTPTSGRHSGPQGRGRFIAVRVHGAQARGPQRWEQCLPLQCTDHSERWDSRREGTPSELRVRPAARLRRAGPTRGRPSSPGGGPRAHAPPCRPEVYTFPGITFSWGRQLANEWRRTGCVGARPVAGRRRQEEEGGAGSELAEPPLAWWRPSRGASPFFLLPAMKLLPAHPRRRRHPEGRSAAEEARSALPSSTWMGTMLSSCRKQENHVSLFLGPPV